LPARKLAIIGWLYVIEGLPMGIFRDLWPVYFRDHGVSLAVIGAVSGLYLAWSIKPLWSPLIDRFGERRQWIAAALCAMAVSLLILPGLDLGEMHRLFWVVLIVFCVGSATQDIAIDAYTIGIVEHGEEGPANSVRIIAYRIGLIAAGGGLLLLPNRIGWTASFAVAAAVMALMAASVFLCPRVEVPLEARRDVRGAFRSWKGRGSVGLVLGFVLLYRLGDLGMAPMLKPLWVDRGLSHEEMALISTTLGAVATMGGAAIGGWIVARLGIGRALLVVGILALLSNLGYAGAAWLPGSGRTGIYAASLIESFCSGLAAAGFLSFLMNICDRKHAAVQYATLTGIYALPGTFAGAASGVAVEWMGYGAYFAVTAALALPAFLFLPAARRWIDEGAPSPAHSEPS
jgi:PAT family beta-lactamase induction signal transducer AmpG